MRLIDPPGEYVKSEWDIVSLAIGVKSFVNNVKGGNVIGAVVDGVGIVLDVAAVTLPVVPGGAGAAIKGVRAIDKAVDAAKTADKAPDTGKAVEKAAFYNGKYYISPDKHGHNEGVWKIEKEIKDLGDRKARLGT